MTSQGLGQAQLGQFEHLKPRGNTYISAKHDLDCFSDFYSDSEGLSHLFGEGLTWKTPATKVGYIRNSCVQDLVVNNTQKGFLMMNNEKRRTTRRLTLPRDTDGMEVDITALRSTDQLISSPQVNQYEPINNDNTYMLLLKETLGKLWNHVLDVTVITTRTVKGIYLLTALQWTYPFSCTLHEPRIGKSIMELCEASSEPINETSGVSFMSPETNM